jgi:small subunit ribosomal protein S16
LAVRIRLTRVGATKRPSYRVVAIDSRRPRDGRALEILGFYDPLTEPATVQLDSARVQAWIGKGAKPSDTVVKLMRQADAGAAPKESEAKPAAKAPAKGSAKGGAKSSAKPRSRKAAAPAAAAADE